MREVSNEMLMAYADGELDADETKSVEEFLAGNPDAAERLEAFTATRAPLADAFNLPILEEIPDRVLDILKPASLTPASEQAVKKERLRELLALIRRGGLGWSAAVAFSMLILMSAGGGWLLGRMGPLSQPGSAAFIAFDGGSLRATGAFAQALERTPSSTFGSWNGIGSERVSLRPVLSFRSTGKRFCRQYELNSASSGSFAGLACRGSGGNWRLVMHKKAADAAPHDGRTAPATGRKTPALDAIVDTMIDGSALGAIEEAKLLKNRWQERP